MTPWDENYRTSNSFRIGWILSPAYDLNPSIDKNGLALNINMEENELNTALAVEVAPFFQVSSSEAATYMEHIREVITTWEQVATFAGIPKAEQQRMSAAFHVRA